MNNLRDRRVANLPPRFLKSDAPFQLLTIHKNVLIKHPHLVNRRFPDKEKSPRHPVKKLLLVIHRPGMGVIRWKIVSQNRQIVQKPPPSNHIMQSRKESP